MFKTRLLSGIVLVIILLFLLIKGDIFILCGLLFISLVGLTEFYSIFKIENTILGWIGRIATCIFYVFTVNEIIILITVFITALFAFVLKYPKYDTKQIMACVFGFLYVPVMLNYVYLLREFTEGGKYIVWLVFLCSWGCDTCAYCAGRLFGKHKMAPVLSPKKTIEGAVGGVIGTLILTGIYCTVFKEHLFSSTTQLIVILIASGFGALVSMVGDLAASAIKRNYDIKDYGNLIPGHGGILDRFDSVIIVSPIIYYVYYLYLNIGNF